MAHRDISPEEAYKNINSSLGKYAEFAEEIGNTPDTILDEILTVDERYQQSARVNQGGMKKILKTIDALTSRPVAKATLIDFEDSYKVESFLREARLTAALEHPNIIPVYDIGVDDKEGPYFIMKLVGGRNLAKIIKSMSSPVDDENYLLRDLMIIFLKTCDAVAYAHSKGIVHLDLKPENIQVGDYGEVLVCDWGLAKVLDQPDGVSDFEANLDPVLYNNVTLDGIIRGTPGYMAPEQIDTNLGPKNQRTDIYALGGILYSLLCLRAPFESETVEGVIEETLIGDLLLPSERAKGRNIPPSLEAVAMKALEIKPEWRYETVSELREEINKWMGGFATEAENAHFMRTLWLLMKRHKTVSILLLLLFFSSVFGVYKIKQNEKIAVANERKAVANEKKAIVSEKKAVANEKKAKESEKNAKESEKKAIANQQKAVDALKELELQKEFTGEVSEQAIALLGSINNYHLQNQEYDKAIEFINSAIELQPDNETVNALKGETHFYRQEYKDAGSALSKSGSFREKSPWKLMLELAPKYSALKGTREYVKAAGLVDLVYLFDGKFRTRLLNFETKKYRSRRSYLKYRSDPEKLPILENHMEFCRLMIHKAHPQKGRKTMAYLNYNYSFENEGISFDFSNSKGLDLLGAIQHLPLYSLNLENTGFWRRWVFEHYHLKSINIAGNKIQKMSYNEMINSGFKEIILSQEQYDQSDIRIAVKKRIKFTIK
jgi:serine/threonine protein kinase